MNYLTQEDERFLEQLRVEFRRAAAHSFDKLFNTDTAQFVGSIIRIEGCEYRDMFDDAPGAAYFLTEQARCVDLEGTLSRGEIRNYAELLFQELKDEYLATSQRHGVEAGLFNPSRVVLINHQGKILDLYEHGAWFESLLPPDSWTAREEEISELLRAAAKEGGWDNFSTADDLRTRATRLSRELELSRRFLAGSG